MKVVKKAEVSAKKYVQKVDGIVNASCTDFKCKHCILSPGPNGCHLIEMVGTIQLYCVVPIIVCA